MTKQNSQEELRAVAAADPRKLNMEEKRKLEKLLIGDIDSAIERFDAIANAERAALFERLERRPAAEIKALCEKHRNARKQEQELQKKLRALGYDVSCGDLRVLRYDGPKEIAPFEARVQERKRTLAALKCSYVIKLFADNADTQGLFGSLAKDLERLRG
jgi:hypothetical protein